MTQADFTIANQTFPNTRAEINTSLQALATNSAGNSAPSTTFANQWWFDSDGDKLYIRNKDNDAWVEVLTIGATSDDVQSLFANVIAEGTADTGVTVDGVLLKDGGFTATDGSTITTADNTDTLTLTSTDADAGVGPNIVYYRNSSSPATDDYLGEVTFRGRNNNSQDVDFARINARLKDVTDGSEDAQMIFNVMTAGSEVEVLRYGQGGTIFNENSADQDFRVESDNNANALFVNGANGNIGLGTSSESTTYELTVHDPSNAQSFMQFTHSTSGVTSDDGYVLGLSGVNALIINYEAGDQIFYTNQIERMRIKSGGDVVVNRTSAYATYKMTIDHLDLPGLSMHNDTGNNTAIGFYNGTDGNVLAGYISVAASGTATTSYNTSSDYRLKENVSYNFDATTRLKQLKPVRFNWIADDTNTVVDGFLAHEVSSAVPEAINGTKDETETKEKVVVSASGNVLAEGIEEADWTAGKIADEQGNTEYPSNSTWEASKVVPKYQGIDHSKLVPLMVKTIQELEARIKTLEDA
jgi:hypothetical protein